MGESYKIPLNDLKSGVLTRSWDVSKEFFEEFENEEVSSADLRVEVKAQKTGASVVIDVDIEGGLTVPCDRCLEDVVMPIDTAACLKLRFGEGSADVDEEDGRELVWIPEGESEFDLSQTIYDYALLDMPIRKCHEDGQCNPDAMKHITDDPGREDTPEKPSETNPFAALKGLFDE